MTAPLLNAMASSLDMYPHEPAARSCVTEGGERELSEFEVRLDSVKLIFAMVSAVYNLKKDQYGVVSVNSKGMRISVESAARSLHATAYLNRDLFGAFNLSLSRGDATEIQFKVNIATLLECLCVYGANSLAVTAVHMSYKEETGLLCMLLEHGGITTECELVTVDVEGMQDYEGAFRAHPTVAKAVIQSDTLHDCFRELCDHPGANTLVITMSPQHPHLRFHTYGGSGSCTIDLSASSDAVLTFEVDKTYEFTYHLRLFEAGIRAVAAAKQTFMRMNARGMLSFAHKIETEDGSHTIINFTIMPDEPSGEGEEGTGVTGEATPASAFIDASCSNSGSGTVASQPSGMHAMRSHGLGGGQSARDPAAPSYEDEDIDHFSAYAHHNRAVTSAGHRSGIEVLADAHRLLSGTGESDSDQEASDGVGGGYDREEYGGSQSYDA